MKGIGNSVRVQKIIGSRIRAARDFAKLSRSEFAELLMKNAEYPEMTPKKTSSEITTPTEKLVNRIKQWERGENAVGLEFIPAICNVLHCDVGYLFGNYEEHYHIVANISAATGLSEKNVARLMEWKERYGQHLGNVANICVESAFQSIPEYILLDVARRDLNEYLNNKPDINDDPPEDELYAHISEVWEITDRAKKHGLATLDHKEAIKFHARSIANTLERYLEEVYVNGID